MANQIGYTFAPGSQSIDMQNGGTRSGATASRQSGPQSAVEVKRLSLPNRFVPGEIAPQALLQSPGGGGQLNTDILRQLMQAFAPAGQQSGVPTLSPDPSPSYRAPQYQMPQVPTLPSGGDTDTTSGWNGHEGGLNRPSSPPPVMEPGGIPQNPSFSPEPSFSPDPPRIIPGDIGRRPDVEEPGGLPAPPPDVWGVPDHDAGAPGPNLQGDYVERIDTSPQGFDFSSPAPEQNNWFQESPFWEKYGGNDIQGFF